MKRKKVVLVLMLLLLLLLSVPAGIGAIYVLTADDVCGNYLYRAYPSPDRKLRAVVFKRNCGATTGFSTHISIVKAASGLPNESGSIYTVAGQPKHVAPELRWMSNSELSVLRPLTGKEYLAARVWAGQHPVEITYGASDG